ncbi:virulence-associated E family protein [Limimaricola sp. ASW11-118]|uniref:Virulence-associated E family protein n=1 Tax=Limimaricola litoreus TaxID=2955316 RepID=A0A9X2FZK7_9RHOB|nr:virulence-associated E family protein [Limimaricola litoreus]MCP1170393.1 virulence-associated E family protein [Limimaricola litoreus]
MVEKVMGRSAVEDMKTFVSGTETNVRLAYRRNAQVFKRQCVFMGSTNNEDFLKDQTGNRRFWPIEVIVDSIDTDRLARAMPQIWAEAVVAYHTMRAVQPHGTLPLHLTSFEAQQEAEELQAASLRENDADMVAAILAEKLNSKVRVGDDFDEANGGATYEWPKFIFSHKIATEWLDGVKVTGQMSQVVAEALGKLGWVKEGRRLIEGYRGIVYVPGEDQNRVWEELDAQENDNVVKFSK